MALYKYPRYETGQGWTRKPGNLEGEILGGPISKYWGALISPPESPLQIPRFIVTPGLFHTLDILAQGPSANAGGGVRAQSSPNRPWGPKALTMAL